jgi:hypothetical protein
MMDLAERVEVETVQLERLKLCILTHLSAELCHSFGEPPEVAVTDALDFLTDDIGIRVVQKVWGRELQRQEVKYPANWWEAVKDRWLPAWAKGRWPVRYRVVTLTARELYPRLAFPPETVRGQVVTVDRSELTW